MAIPRPWLIVMTVLGIMTLLGVGAIWFSAAGHPGVAVEEANLVLSVHTGKWGNLTVTPITISPPMELVFTDWGFMPRPTWFFPGADVNMVARILESAGVAAADVERLRARAQFDRRIAGIILTPDPAWARALTPEVRAKIYRTLARSELNLDQNQAFRYPGTDLEKWLGSDQILPRTRQLVEPLIYRDDGYMVFADIQLVRSEIDSEDELRRLSKALFQQPTVMARLSVGREANLDALIEYWGRGGRRTTIRPLIESVAGGEAGRSIDIAYLLPPFAKNHLYRYPQLSVADLDKPAVVNCLWTALNFFKTEPDDRFLDAAVALKTLKEDYFVVESNFELGDIVAFLDEKGDVFHASVHIADDLVFSKNGFSAMAPWTLMSLNEVKSCYRWRSENPRLIFHRWKNF